MKSGLKKVNKKFSITVVQKTIRRQPVEPRDSKLGSSLSQGVMEHRANKPVSSQYVHGC